mgnify:CR=1 FL=1
MRFPRSGRRGSIQHQVGRVGPLLGLLLGASLSAGVARGQEPPPAEAQAEAEATKLEFEGVAEVAAPPREATKHTLEAEQLTTIPGTRGDALRAIEILPGVSRTPFAANPGPPLLRGSPSVESLVLFDGASLSSLYHFGGLTSVFNSQLLENVTLYPGNYSARYGRATGGVVDARIRDPKSDRLHAMLELSAIDSFALVEGPLGERTSLALAARRSNIDFFIDALITEESTAVVAAPVYWDYQAILAHRFSEAHKLRAVAYGSYDAFELHFGEAAGEDPALRGEFGTRVSFHRAQLELESRLSPSVEQDLMISVGPSPGRGRLGNVSYDFDSFDVHARADWALFAAPWLRLDTGLDVQAVYVSFRYEGPAPPPDEGVPVQGSLASEGTRLYDAELEALRAGTFVEASLKPARQLLIIPGLRLDYFSDAAGWTLDPRLTTRLEVTPATTLKAGVGSYSQPPQYWEVMKEFGNQNLEAFRAVQASAGFEQSLGESVRADLDGFYKRWDNRVVLTPGGIPPRYVNGGTGNAYGLELLLDVRFAPKSQALLAYTLSRSTRRDAPDAETRLFDRDQTHNLSLTANYDLGRGWLVGARFRYVTGNPYSAVEGAVYDGTSDTYRPVYGGINQARHRAFHQLDVRVEKLWQIGPVALTTYLEVMNAYAANNHEARRYSFDYRESASVSGMPFFPNVGIRGEL